MKKLLQTLALLLLSTTAAHATQSTINTTIPVQGAPLQSAPIRNNFIAAYNDINNLYSLVGTSGSGGSGTPGGISGQIQYNNSGSFGGFTMSGDCTIVTSTGAITCAKSGGQNFGTAAFQNTGNSGASIPFLNGTNTWSGANTFSSGVTLGAITGATQCLQVNTSGSVSGTGVPCGSGGGGGSVSSVATNNGITGGTITSTGTIGLASVATNSALCNNVGSTQPPTAANCQITGTGYLVMAGSPTLTTPQVTGNLNLSSGSQYQINGAQISASNLSNGVTGSGAVMLAASPTTTGTLTGAAVNLSGNETVLGTVAIGSTTATTGTSLDLATKTNAMIPPKGTTAQRPTGVAGMIRYNTSLNTMEAFINAAWNQLAGYGNFAINVMAWPYHAACDGTTNDTATITSAFSVGLPLFVPPTFAGCAVSSLPPATGSWIMGTSPPQYDSDPGSPWSHLVPASGATAIWNFNGIRGVLIENLDTLGSPTHDYASNMTCINAGSTSQDEFLFSSFRFCGNGGFGDASNYPNNVISLKTNWIANGQNASPSGGLVNLVDSEVNGGSFTANSNAFYFGPGANNNVITADTRIEFNVNYGIQCNGATKNVFFGQFDRNANAAIAFADCGRSTGFSGNGSGIDYTGVADGITVGGVFTRNGTTATSGAQAHFEFQGNNTNIVFTGIATSHDCGDGGCASDGPNSPKYIVEYADSTDRGIRFVGGQLNGYTTAFQNNITGDGPGDYGIEGSVGVESIFPYNNTFNGAIKLNPVPTPPTPTITPHGTGGSSTWSYKIVAVVNGTSLHTAASAAGSTTSGNATLTTSNYNVIQWAPVAGAYEYLVYRTAHGTSPSTNGLIATVPATQNLNTLQDIDSFGGGGIVWDTGLAGDGSTAPSTDTTGSLTLAGISGSTQCLHVDTNGVVSGTGSDCGAGGGGSVASPVGGVQYNSASAFGADASFTYAGNGAVTIGTSGHTGSLALKGTSSGTATLTVPSAAGTPTITFGSNSGTPAVTVSAPLALSTSTGNLTVTGAAGKVLAGATPAFTATPTLGASGTLGSLTMGNATSGTITLQPVTGALGTVTVSLPAATDTLMGKATTDTMTNKTFDTAGTGNVFKINGTAISSNTGTGANVLATSPSLTTPTLGVATATSINGNTFTTGTYTLTGSSGKTLTFSNSLTLAGTDSTTMTFPSSNGTIATTNLNETYTAAKRAVVSTPTISTSTFTPNFDTGQDFIINLTSACPCTIANPSTTPVAGQHGVIYIVQDATGGRTVGTWGSQYYVSGGTSGITQSTGANAIDTMSYVVKDSTHIILSPAVLNATH